MFRVPSASSFSFELLYLHRLLFLTLSRTSSSQFWMFPISRWNSTRTSPPMQRRSPISRSCYGRMWSTSGRTSHRCPRWGHIHWQKTQEYQCNTNISLLHYYWGLLLFCVKQEMENAWGEYNHLERDVDRLRSVLQDQMTHSALSQVRPRGKWHFSKCKWRTEVFLYSTPKLYFSFYPFNACFQTKVSILFERQNVSKDVKPCLLFYSACTSQSGNW